MLNATVDNQAKSFMPINLQLFAEGEGAVASVVESTPVQTPDMGQSDLSVSQRLAALFEGASTDTPAAVQQPVQVSQEPTPEALLAGKFKTTDDLVGAYQSIQSEFTKKAQSLSEFQRTADTLKAENERLAAQLAELSQGQGQAQQQDQFSTEDYGGLDSQSYLDQFYEKPQEVLSKTIESVVQKALEPFMQKVNPVVETVNAQMHQDNWNKATKSFMEANQDMGDFTTEMKQYIQERGLSGSDNPEQVLQDAYIYARGMKYQPQQAVDPKTYLQDPNFINENILNNPEIVNMILQKQMAQINSQPIPTSIAGQQAGQAPAMPTTKPKTLKEANSLFSDMFSRGLL
jgi:hypothetical protein